MEPGLVAVQGALWGGAAPGGLESMLLLGVEVPVSHHVAPVAWFGVQRRADGAFEARDGILAVQIQPVSRPDFGLRIQPGISIPTGGIGGGLTITPLSTGSVDPWLAADAVVGTDWMLGGSMVTRVPIYRGNDGVRQGPFIRGDLRFARRLAYAVPMIGVSAVRQAPGQDMRAGPSFTELAGTLASVFHVGPKWSLTVQGRIPLWLSQGAPRVLSAAVGARWVVGSVPEGHEH